MTRGGEEIPTLAVGSLDVLAACARRLALHLDPDERRSRRDAPQFDLLRAVNDELRAAHTRAEETGADLASAIRTTPPDDAGLEPEERIRFEELIETYADVAGERPGRLDPRSGSDLAPRASRDGGFALSARPELVFEVGDRVEVRRLRLRADATAPAPEERLLPGALAIVLRHDGPVDVVDIPLGGGSTRVTTIEPGDLGAVGDRIRHLVRQARQHPAPTPGWYCRDCAYLRGCTAIPQASPEDVTG